MKTETNEPAVKSEADAASPTNEVTYHHDGHGLNEATQIVRVNAKGPGGAHHAYKVYRHEGETRRVVGKIHFQKGPRNEPGSTPGMLDSALLAIVLDRYVCFQKGGYGCEENQEVIDALKKALDAMKRRVDKRAARGVLETNAK